MRKWTKKTIISKIQELDSLEINLSAEYIAKMDSSLYKTATSKRYFSGWRNALKAAGIDYAREWKKTLRPELVVPRKEHFFRRWLPTFSKMVDKVIKPGKILVKSSPR